MNHPQPARHLPVRLQHPRHHRLPALARTLRGLSAAANTAPTDGNGVAVDLTQRATCEALCAARAWCVAYDYHTVTSYISRRALRALSGAAIMYTKTCDLHRQPAARVDDSNGVDTGRWCVVREGAASSSAGASGGEAGRVGRRIALDRRFNKVKVKDARGEG